MYLYINWEACTSTIIGKLVQLLQCTRILNIRKLYRLSTCTKHVAIHITGTATELCSYGRKRSSCGNIIIDIL